MHVIAPEDLPVGPDVEVGSIISVCVSTCYDVCTTKLPNNAVLRMYPHC